MTTTKKDTGNALPGATPAPEAPAWAVSASGWNGRILYDIRWRDFIKLPGLTKAIVADVDAAAEEGWVRGVEPKTRRFLLEHGIDRVLPIGCEAVR